MNVKKSVLPIVLSMVSAVCYAQTEFKTDAEKFSFAAGVFSTKGIKPLTDIEENFDTGLFLKGVEQAMSGDELPMTDDEMLELLQAVDKKRIEAAEKERVAMGKTNVEQGKAFREEYAKKENVKKTESGMYYSVITEGEGEPPLKESTVVVHYSGKLIDGTEFDSSRKHGTPATFPLANVIAGWTEIVQLMKPGAKYEVVIPPELAYADRGAGPQIGPNATLVFDIELLEVKSAQVKPEAVQAIPEAGQAIPE